MTRAFWHRLRAVLGRRVADEEGAVTVPFVIMFPIFLVIVISSIELGIITVRHVMLERGLDITVRQLRLGTWANPSHDLIKRSICNGAGIIPDCTNSLLVEMRPISKSTWAGLDASTQCVDRSRPIFAPRYFASGASDELVVIRACIKVSPMAPTTGLGMMLRKDGAGQYALISSTAFVNEPR